MLSARFVLQSPIKPILIYDGDCNFCRRWAARWQARTQGAIDITPSKQPIASVQLVESDWTYTGAEAAFRALSYGPGPWGQRLFRLYRRSVVFAVLSEWVYGIAARHRPFFSLLCAF
ncbi:MAG: hypothetical protein A3J74_06905 [Elusimicrobia bacterium RIFCSPHIGHO2_02_FULL_57_9]|nr:MAG: hypothetical protein A3J74_06905 [Elusimicrobia bacterium RIFCSPHIGHO2_02_FULL_57_9]